MTRYKSKLPERRCHARRTPWNVVSELFELNMRFLEHQLHNTRAFCEDYVASLPESAKLAPGDVLAYIDDSIQRGILFADTIRKRGDHFIIHQAQGNPPVLKFDYDVVVDGKTLPRPVNYSLARIIPPKGIAVDGDKRPFVIVDPRAGHGPGIGGFKSESQVGVALGAGHPVYFVIFDMHPVPGQSLRDVAQAEAEFLRYVAREHPKADKACVLGNCQGGWAVMGVAAAYPELVGPLVLSGAPLSYWAGVTGKNPMRYMGGLSGGSWIAYLMSDLGNGEFDGANLVANFESLDPANSLWTKYYNLYANIDSEPQRFLDFELWWGGYMLMTSQEMHSILENLFIGNKLSHGQIAIDKKLYLDLRRVQQPIIIFCSKGDNITPPQQALNWIADLYDDERAIKAAGQTIVYMIHEHSGHLGIFVSGAIVGREHAQIAATLEQIESLPPGLYEMSIIDASEKNFGDVRLEERTIAQLLSEGGAPQQSDAEFRLVKAVSDFNGKAYEMFAAPLVRALSNRYSAEALRLFHPMRVQHWAFSSLNPLMWWLPFAAEEVEKVRGEPDERNPLSKLEEANSKVIEYLLNSWRDGRDIGSETLFYGVYGMLAALGLAGSAAQSGHNSESERAQVSRIVATAAQGDARDAVMRILLLLTHARGHLSRSEIDLLHERLTANGDFAVLPADERRERLHRQTVIVAYEPDVALETLPRLLATAGDRHKVAELLGELDGIVHDKDPAVQKLWRRIEPMLGEKRVRIASVG